MSFSLKVIDIIPIDGGNSDEFSFYLYDSDTFQLGVHFCNVIWLGFDGIIDRIRTVF